LKKKRRGNGIGKEENAAVKPRKNSLCQDREQGKRSEKKGGGNHAEQRGNQSGGGATSPKKG